MRVNLSEKLRSLRKEKNVSQEKLAQYLNVSFQAVSKWETGSTYPDIAVLPEIARFFGITIDELLQVEKIDEQRLYYEYERRAEAAFRNGRPAECVSIWREAYKRMPNNIEVKEMLMSAYFDTDKIKYQNEILDLGMDIYNSDVPMYYKGQAIREMANTYAESGNIELAEKWVKKTVPIFHSQEILYTQILDGDEMLSSVSFCTYWFFNCLFYMASRIDGSATISKDEKHKQDVYKTVARLYEVLYPNDDMSFESLKLLCLMHLRIAKMEIALEGEEETIPFHMARASALAIQSTTVEEHELSHPLLSGWHIQAAPSDNKQVVRMLNNTLAESCFDGWRNAEWFAAIKEALERALSG